MGLKVCNIVPFFAPQFGGVVDRCYHITKELARRGHSVTLCTSDYQFDQNYADTLNNVDIKVFNSFLGRFCITPRLKSFLDVNATQFDVFHLMNNYSYVNVVSSRFCIENKIPYMYSAMGSLPIMSRSYFRKYIFNKSIGKIIVRNANILCAITEQEREQYMAYDKNVSSTKIIKIQNAIEDPFDPSVSASSFRHRFHIPPNCKIVLFVGRLEYVKGADLLIEAFARLHNNNPSIVLAIVGPDYGELTKLKDLIGK
nr:glycosyltransferase [Candidatus Dadabacteria bacterium]